MQETFEHSNLSFELFGFDFVIDKNLKCWLIEANMSPAIAARKNQQWFQKMVEDMADGLLNIVEYKVLRNMVNQKIDFQGAINKKLDEIR